MPNTLAHIGIQTLAARTISPRFELGWIWLGCVLPDVPWILQRILRAFPLGLDPYDLRLYAIAQSSLALSCLLSFALASFATVPRRVGGLLAGMSLLHLLLDATQTKWANGVHLFAPVSWKLLNLGLYWPEELTTALLTALGAVVGVYAWRQGWFSESKLVFTSRRLLIATVLLLLYLLVPLGLLEGPELADNHAVGTLRSHQRAGKEVAFDRNQYRVGENGDWIVTLAGEELGVDGPSLGISGTVSARGHFVAQNRVALREVHLHRSAGRDLWSYVGLALVLWVWVGSAICSQARRLRKRFTE